MDELAILPQHIRRDEDVLDRAVLASQPCLGASHVLTCPQPLQNVLDHIRVGVKFGDVVADVLVRRVAE
jgi:hypothetical protein